MLLLPCSDSPSIVNISSNVGHLIQRRCCLYVASDSAASIRRATVWNVLQYSVVGTRYYILIVELWINTGVAGGRRVDSSTVYSFLFMPFWYTSLILANRIPAFYTTLHHDKFRVATQACRRNRHGLDTSKTKYLDSNDTQDSNFPRPRSQHKRHSVRKTLRRMWRGSKAPVILNLGTKYRQNHARG
jgi:hypothetical protein